MNEQTTNAWTLTDEEWCDLCFMVVELGAMQEQLQNVLLAEQRPALSQVWAKANAYRTSSQTMMQYLSESLRAKAGIQHRRSA